MKPITFEAIRNLLKTNKKKNKDKSIDQSFKRSDSFKRISIRKSYLERNRRRNVLKTKTTVIDLNDLEFKSTTSSLDSRHDRNETIPDDDSSSQEPSIIAELERKDASIDEKIRALQEINERYFRENQRIKEAGRQRHQAPIPKPPRASKLKLPTGKKTETVEVQTEPKHAQKKSTTLVPIQTTTTVTGEKKDCDEPKSPIKKTVSQINIRLTGDTERVVDSLPKSYQDRRQQAPSLLKRRNSRSKSVEDDQSSFYSISTFTLDSNNDQGTTSTRHSDFSRSVSCPRGTQEDNSSFLTFSTYCSPNDTVGNYLETNFDCSEPTTLNSNAGENNGKQSKKNVSTTSLVYEPERRPVINTQTFKMIKSKYREGVIIKIPAIEVPEGQDHNDTDKDNLNRQSSNDSAVEADSNSSVEKLNSHEEKSTVNATISYEKIVQAFEKQEVKYKKNPRKVKREYRKDRLEKDKELVKRSASDSKLNMARGDEVVYLSNDSIASPRSGTFDFPLPPASPNFDGYEKSSYNNKRNSYLVAISGKTANKLAGSENGTFESGIGIGDHVTDTYDKETSSKFLYPKDYFEEENNLNLYKEESGIAVNPTVPLKIKENPFTKHKEIYAMNTSRIWKQLCGEDEEGMSIVSSNPHPVPAPLKLKNESFKSMSSHDSGFSLTLTKPKNLFRRKSKKQRRKPKLSVSRDGYFKRVMVVQRNSTKRKKGKNSRPQGKDVFKTMNDDNWIKLAGNDAEMMREFENYCHRNNFNKEMDDLEEFYEEHLKRLKYYYIQRKQMNEAAIREFYREFHDDDLYDAYVVSRNNTFRFKEPTQRPGAESPEYLFPYPDKRVHVGKKRNKNPKFPEVRTFKSHIFGAKYAEDQYHDSLTNPNLKNNKEFAQFPYWKLSRKISKRERIAPKFKDTLLKQFESQFRQESLRNEVCLADIFPSVNQVESVESIKDHNDSIDQVDGGAMDKKHEQNQTGELSSGSDEFSEQEFIANCLGENIFCSTCDKNNSDCECYIDDCDNVDNNDDERKVTKITINGTSYTQKVKSVKRRKSKKRVHKNQSTLRRKFNGKYLLFIIILT